MCQIPHQAVMKSIPPRASSGGKILGLNRSTKPKPEFWMPVSMVNVLLSAFGSLNMVAKLNPVDSANKL